MGSFGFGYIQPVRPDPVGYAQQFQQLRALAEQRQQRQQEMELRQQEAAQTQQINALNIQKAQQAQAQTQALNESYSEAFDPSQPSGYDLGKLQAALVRKGQGAAFAGQMEHLDKVIATQDALTKHKFELANLQADHGGAIGAAVKAEGYDPSLFLTYAQAGLRNGTISRERAQPAIEAVAAAMAMDPSGAQARALVQHFSDNLIANSPAQQKLLTERQTAEEKGVEIAGKQRAQAASDLIGRMDQNAGLVPDDQYAALRQKYPDLLPATQDAAANRRLIRSTIPRDKLAEYDQQQQILALKPEDILSAGSQMVPQSITINGKPYDTSFQSQTAQREAQALLARGDKVGAMKVFSTAADRLSNLQNQVLTEGAKAPIKIYTAGQEAQNRAAIQANAPAAPGNTKLTGDEYLATLPPAQANVIRGMAEGRLTAPSPNSRAKGAQEKLAALLQYDPQFSEQRAQMRKAFTTGKQGDNIAALNTAAVHLDQLSQAAEALHNGNFRPGNEAFNNLIAMFGGSAPTNFDGIKTAVAGEMATALKGNATDQEIRHVTETIQSKNSPKQLADYVNEQLHVLGAKLNTYQERWTQQNPNDKVWSPVLPSARSVYEKHGVHFAGGGGTQQTGGGGTQAAAVPANVKAALANVGPGVHKLSNGTTWIKDASGNIRQQ